MTISLRYGHFDSPMRFRFKHSSADRTETQNVIVSLTDEKERVGYGEGCPRKYVTGETSQSVCLFLDRYGGEISQASESLETLQDWILSNQGLIDQNPSAFCSVELAALDLLGKRENISIEALLNLPPMHKPVGYTAVIGDGSPKKTQVMSWAYRLFGFSDFKVKLSGVLVRDKQRLATLPGLAKTRVDANNFWRDAETCITYCEQLEHSFWGFEEPVGVFDVDAMRAISRALGIKIILDESLVVKNHLTLYSEDAALFVCNIRISKCGGILRSIELAKLGQLAGHDIILGAHVGETSVLTRAALVVGQSLEKAPLAREGAYGRILLKRDISTDTLRFGKNGILLPDTYQLSSKAGFGIQIVPNTIKWQN